MCLIVKWLSDQQVNCEVKCVILLLKIQDVAMLEKLIQDDVAAAKTPVLLLAYAGDALIFYLCQESLL